MWSLRVLESPKISFAVLSSWVCTDTLTGVPTIALISSRGKVDAEFSRGGELRRPSGLGWTCSLGSLSSQRRCHGGLSSWCLPPHRRPRRGGRVSTSGGGEISIFRAPGQHEHQFPSCFLPASLQHDATGNFGTRGPSTVIRTTDLLRLTARDDSA